ncbi:MAG: APC family permease [Gemmatimonadaceae bacterium]
MPSSLIRAKRLLVGRPLATERLEHERLNKKTALAVLSSDAISSVAYATDQILFVLGGSIGVIAIGYVVPISLVIVGLLLLVGLSYRQTIFAYPNGGGSYTVARENLGVMPGLIAASALLTDYILTVAVSISSGVAAMTSAYPSLVPHTIAICTGSIILLTVINLRGVRESGAVFSAPTYAFIAMMVALICIGAWRAWTGHELPVAIVHVPKVDPVSARLHGTATDLTGFALFYLLLRGFAEGCSAMTGTEAISNGIQAFKAPAQKNASRTLVSMVLILATFVLGVAFLDKHYMVMHTAQETVLSQLGHRILGYGAAYYILQYSTFAVLVLAANTAFADFPRLSGILATDRFMPRQFAARGDRLAFSNGIIMLAAVAILLVTAFRGDTTALVPLYAIGVFVCFTLSQAGMVVHWFRSKEAGWRWRAGLNGLGAVATGIVSIVQVLTKFTAGGWIIVLIIPIIIWFLTSIKTHYDAFATEIAFDGVSPVLVLHHTVVVPVAGITKAVAGALSYATAISDDVRALAVNVDPITTQKLNLEWETWDIGVNLIVLDSPYRSVVRPIVNYVDSLSLSHPGELVTVVVPEIVPRRWWEHLLHNKTALYIRTAFLFKSNVVVTSVPYQLGHSLRLRDAFARDEQMEEEREAKAKLRAESVYR